MKKILTKNQIEEMGVDLIKAFTDAGNTVITNKEGVETLKKLEDDNEDTERKKRFLEEFMMKINTIKIKKPKHKYPSNYTPPKKKRKK